MTDCSKHSARAAPFPPSAAPSAPSACSPRAAWREERDMTLTLAIPSKGRLQEQAAEFFRGCRPAVEAGGGCARLSRDDARAGRRCDAAVGVGDCVRAGRRRRASRYHGRRPPARDRAGIGVAHCAAASARASGSPMSSSPCRRPGSTSRRWPTSTTSAPPSRIVTAGAFASATKYTHLTRAFFAHAGISDYRIVESAGRHRRGATAGTAEAIVDITTTGATLAANGLKILGRRHDHRKSGATRREPVGAVGRAFAGNGRRAAFAHRRTRTREGQSCAACASWRGHRTDGRGARPQTSFPSPQTRRANARCSARARN